MKAQNHKAPHHKARNQPTSRASEHPDSPWTIESIPLDLLNEPLDYILADHGRKRKICSALRDIANAHLASRSAADTITAFLTGGLKLHHADEDENLFPALRRRLLPEDNLGVVLARLGEDHRRAEALIDAIAGALTQNPAADPVRLSASECELLQFYANAEQEHLALENAVVMGIARLRLTKGDLRTISEGMKSRRGVPIDVQIA